MLDLSGAAAPPPSAAAEPRGVLPDAATGDAILARVGAEELRASDLARHLLRFSPDRALDGLGQMIDARIIDADAAAAGIVLPEGEVASRTEEEIRARETDLRVQYGPSAGLEEYLADRFGFSLEGYRSDIARLVRLQALRDRLVRFAALGEDRIRIRVLVVADEATARESARRLEEGADFAALARQVSLAPPDDLPAYPRDEIHPPELAEELFALPAGGVSRPVRVARDGVERFEVFKVVDVQRGAPTSWSEAREGVERGLRDRPVSRAEYLQWARRARARHGVQVSLEEPAVGGSR